MNKQEPIQNQKCFECRFCLWYEEYLEYRCGIRGCGIRGCKDNSLFVEYQIKRKEDNT